MTHILVTNDDGVHSPGLLALKQALEPLGRVSVIAPDSNRSAIGRGITIHHPLHVEEVRLADGSAAFATDGTPVVAAPVVSGQTVLVVTRDGGLFAFRPH